MKPVIDCPDEKNMMAFDIVERVVSNYSENSHLLLGITGAGGAGKTTFAQNIVSWYGSDVCVSIDLDDYLLSRKERSIREVSGYHPNANRLLLARDNLADLMVGKKIRKPRYNHSTGELLEYEEVMSKPLIIVEGVTTLYAELRNLMSVAFFLDALEETQIKSRVERDVKKRGYSLDQALALYENLKPEYERFILPTQQFASVVFKVSPDYVMHTMRCDLKAIGESE